MKSFLFLLILTISGQARAALSYSINIDNNGYNLTMDMVFRNGQKLESIRGALKNGDVLSLLSPNVVSVKNTPYTEGKYQSLMLVKSFGIYSRLLSICEDKFKGPAWSRSCSLQTRQMDGGKYMLWKGDEVECTEKEGEVNCHFLIKGQTRALRLLGVQIVSAELFSVKAKVQAMANFFKYYFYIKDHNLSPKLALKKFEQSPLKTELDFFEKEATKAVKTSGKFQKTYTFLDQV